MRSDNNIKKNNTGFNAHHNPQRSQCRVKNPPFLKKKLLIFTHYFLFIKYMAFYRFDRWTVMFLIMVVLILFVFNIINSWQYINNEKDLFCICHKLILNCVFKLKYMFSNLVKLVLLRFRFQVEKCVLYLVRVWINTTVDTGEVKIREKPIKSSTQAVTLQLQCGDKTIILPYSSRC